MAESIEVPESCPNEATPANLAMSIVAQTLAPEMDPAQTRPILAMAGSNWAAFAKSGASVAQIGIVVGIRRVASCAVRRQGHSMAVCSWQGRHGVLVRWTARALGQMSHGPSVPMVGAWVLVAQKLSGRNGIAGRPQEVARRSVAWGWDWADEQPDSLRRRYSTGPLVFRNRLIGAVARTTQVSLYQGPLARLRFRLLRRRHE